MKSFIFVLLAAATLPGCATPPSPREVAATDEQRWVGESSSEIAAPRDLKEQAVQFDRFLRQELPPEEAAQLISSCRDDASANPFCSTIVGIERWQASARRRAGGMGRSGGGRRAALVLPRFRGSRVTNWKQLRFGSPNDILKGLKHASLPQLLDLKDHGVAERLCPNNAAIATAASLESYLPDGAGFRDIAKLYEKGGDCLTKSPNDRVTFLTRAGLFYYLDKRYTDSALLFARAASIPESPSSTALYWLYRSHQKLSNPIAARAALERLKTRHVFSFHTLMARMAEGDDPDEILTRAETVSLTRSRQVPLANQLIEQVEILHRFGLRESAAKVLDWAVRESQAAEPELMVYLAELKREQEAYPSKITLLSKVLVQNPHLVSRKTMELYFPKAYFPIFEKHSAGLDPYLLLAIARQESAFNPRAVSIANAQGLLQVLPSTKRRVLGSSDDVPESESGVAAGARYFVGLLREFNLQLHLALAGYNAGPNRVVAWTQRYPATEPILFIDLIPFRETRGYVAAILRNYYWYRRIHQPAPTKLPWLAEGLKAGTTVLSEAKSRISTANN